jgi:hypothetical protein
MNAGSFIPCSSALDRSVRNLGGYRRCAPLRKALGMKALGMKAPGMKAPGSG